MKSKLIPEWTRAVFFDAVGTVLHPEPGAATVYAEAAARYGLDFSTETIAKRFREAFQAQEQADEQAGWVTNEEREIARWRSIANKTLPGAPEDCFEYLYQHFAGPESWCVPDDAISLIRHLASRGLILGLASNYDSRLNSVLSGHRELALLNKHVVISSEIGFRKPGAGFFDRLASQTGCRHDEVALIGDDFTNDYQGATAVGMNAILLDPDGQYPAITERIASLTELIASRP